MDDRAAQDPGTSTSTCVRPDARRRAAPFPLRRNGSPRRTGKGSGRPGGRNHALNAAAFALGQLTATGLVPADLARDALAQAAQAIGLATREAAATIRSGLTAGTRNPRRFPVGTRP